MAKKWEEARVAREAKLDGLQERLVGAVDGLVTGEDWQRAMTFAARFRSRSFNNTLLIWSQHLDAFDSGRVSVAEPSYVAGFRQWQTLGRQVDKGQSGYMIFAPVTARFASATPADAASWRRLERGEKPRAGEVSRSKVVGVKPAYVWDVSQTSGDPIPEHPMPVLLEGEAPAGLWEGLAAQIEARGFTVLRVPNEGMLQGLLKVWLTPGFMPPGRRPFGEQARIQPGSVYPNAVADACGDRSARPSARSLSAT